MSAQPHEMRYAYVDVGHSYDYTGFSDTSRASIQMTHLANGPLVSLEEAQRIEKETAQHLLKSRKLSLIVDLDQTIVHATVDPTVGEWIAEGEAWEARQAQKAEAVAQNKEADSDDTASDVDDEVNPNWEALKDVKKFRLGPEALGQPSFRGPKGKGKEKAVENDGCMYYIKPRYVFQAISGSRLVNRTPDLAGKTSSRPWRASTRCMCILWVRVHMQRKSAPPLILKARSSVVASLAEMKAEVSLSDRPIGPDPDGCCLEGLTQKSLQRLFPSDQSMVVIIDDRADVWEWSPNLVKVIPCTSSKLLTKLPSHVYAS